MQNSIKLTYEPPKGIKSNVIRCYNLLENTFFNSVTDNEKKRTLMRAMYCLALFHGVLLERKKFGPLGWNIQYGFSLSDFQISKDLLRMFVQNYNKLPFEALNYMTSEAN